MSTKFNRIALLIDAENASPKQFKTVMDHVNGLGRVTIRSAYGDPAALKKWEKTLAEHVIVPVQTPSFARKANASDFALTIDAVAALHRGHLDHLCLVTSDADFALLATHVRREGKHVTAFGEKKTPEAFRDACDEFVVLGSTGATRPVAAPAAKKAPSKTSPAKKPAISRHFKPPINHDKLRALYDEAAAASPNGVTVQHMSQVFKRNGIDYRGYRTLTNYLAQAGFKVAGNRVMPAPS